MKIVIAGDFCPQYRVADRFKMGDYEPVLGEVRDVISSADYSIVNFECPITEGSEKPIVKQGPNLQCSEKGMEAVKWTGFDCVTLANNHFFDYGKDGVQHTLEACEKYGIDTVGGGKNLQEASKILYKEIEGKTLAIINCCEHEFSIATEDSAGSNPLNPIQQYYVIKEARTKADYVLVIVHGGHEHYQLPSPRMQETYRFFVDAGADAVVNHHQHCYSGYEIYNGKPVFYGLGNFCFDNPNYFTDLWSYGYMVKINFSDNISFDIIPYEQCSDKPAVRLRGKNSVADKIKELNEVITDERLLADETASYYRQSAKSIQFVFEPRFCRLIGKLFRIGWLSRLMKRGKFTRLQNVVMCEAHRDKLMYFLNNTN